MTHQFPQATKNLLRAIDCPCFADENREAVQQFLSRFAEHVVQETHGLRADTEVQKTYIHRVLSGVSDMAEENALTPTLTQLQDMLTWPDGWNSYDALAPNPAAVSHATQWITELYQHLASQKQQWIAPNVTASADGAVNITWRQGEKMLEMLIDEQDIYYLQGWSKDAKYTDGSITSIEDMQQLWQWLLEPGQEQEA